MATIRGDQDDNILKGTKRADTILGLAGSDVLDGRGGADHLAGGDDADALIGSSGDDLLDGGRGGDALDGGDGSDTATFASLNGPVSVDLDFGGFASSAGGTDALTSVENFIGTAKNDSFFLSLFAVDNIVHGGDGDDAIDDQGGGNDRQFGGDGNDELFDSNGGDDFLSGGRGNDVLAGGEGRDFLDGGPGRDTLFINSGGPDIAIGGPGADEFFVSVFAPEGDPVFVADFARGSDHLTIDNTVFDGDGLFMALDSDHSGRLDDSDEFVSVERVTFRGTSERSTVLEVGALLADAGGTASGPELAQVTLFGVSSLGAGDITGIVR